MIHLIRNESKGIKFFYYGTLGFLAIYLVMNIWGNNSLFADGSLYFTGILTKRSFFIIEPGTELFEASRQIFCVIAIKLGIANIKILNYLYSFGCLYLQIIFTVLSLNLCIKNKKYNYFYLVIMCVALQIVFTGFFVMMGYISYAMMCVYSFLYLLFYNKKIKRSSKIYFSFFMALSFFRAFSIFLFIGTVIILLMTYKILAKKVRIDWFYIMNIIICISGWFYAFDTVINPRDSNNKAGYINSILSMDKTVYIILLSMFFALLFSMIMSILNTKYYKVNRWLLYLSLLFQVVSGFVLLYYVFTNNYSISLNSYKFRVLNLAIPFATLLYILIIEIFNISLSEHIYKYCNILLLTAGILFVSASTINYNYYIKAISDSMINSVGYVEVSKVKIPNAYFWGWTNPLESLYAQIINDRLHIKAVIVNEESYSGYKPFDDRDITQYPSLQRYGISYDKDSFKE